MKEFNTIIKEMEQEAEAIGFDQISDPKVGSLLKTLVASKQNATIIELGTGVGISTAWIMQGLTSDSRMMTVDNDSRLIKIAQKHLPHDPRVAYHVSTGEELIDSLEANSVDIVFADTWPGKYYYVDEALSLLKVGGMYIIDDMLPQENWPDGHDKKVEDLIKYLKARKDLQLCEIHWATGVVICTKIESEKHETNKWNPEKYNKHTSFVSELALPVVDLLAPKAGEKILDAGCGDGTLALEIERRGANVHGIDMSAQMVEDARLNGVDAEVMSVTDMPFVDEFDAVFSNAMLHWVRASELAVVNIAKALKLGGRFVAEFGGAGNVYRIVEAMKSVFGLHPEWGEFRDIWYFPTPQEYSKILESNGFEVSYIELIPRPTPIDDIANWLAVFTNGVTGHLADEQRDIFRQEVRSMLETTNYTEAEGWMADYVRLRVKAVKLV